MKKILCFLVISLYMFSCVEKKNDEITGFDHFIDEYFGQQMALFPMKATANNIEDFNDQLNLEMTDAFLIKVLSFYQKTEEQLKTYDFTKLTEEQRISYRIVEWEIDRVYSKKDFPMQYMPIHQFGGTHLTMGQYASASGAQPFKTVKDYENWQSRSEKFIVWMDSAQLKMKQGVEKGITIPKALAIKVIPQFETLAETKLEDHLYYSPIKNIPKGFANDEKEKIIQEYSSFLVNKLLPAFAKMTEFLKTEYLPNCRETSGISGVSFGEDLYEELVKDWTTTDLSPNEIHEIGLAEVKRIRYEMEKVKEQVGFEGDLTSFFDFVRDNPDLKPFTEPQQVIDNFNKIHQKVKPHVDNLFSLQPRMAFEIKRTEAFREKTASAEYSPGAIDGSRPGKFYVPIPDVRNYNVYGDEDLFLHEAIPGHHFQIALQMENDLIPEFRKFHWFGAYGEGWALYTESLGKELGLYEDPYQYFGMLGNEIHRAIRLVVDTGLHSKGWTREQAIQYSLDNEAESESSIIAEIERYMAIPGQALSYKIGQRKIRELRSNAEKQMRERFKVKEFHKIVLESGVLPLTLLEEKVNHWIKNNS